jgi:hypothetical protein
MPYAWKALEVDENNRQDGCQEEMFWRERREDARPQVDKQHFT